MYSMFQKMARTYYLQQWTTSSPAKNFSDAQFCVRGCQSWINFVKGKNLLPVYTHEYVYLVLTQNPFKGKIANLLIHGVGIKMIKLASRKYNLSVLAFTILDLFPALVTRKNYQQLSQIEKHFILNLSPFSNILTEDESNFGYKHSAPILERLKVKQQKPFILYNLNGTLYKEFISCSEAARHVNCSSTRITMVLKRTNKLLKTTQL